MSGTMRIAMIQDDWWPRTGGGPVHVKELSKALAANHDCEIDILTRAIREDGERYDSVEKHAGGKVVVHRLAPCTKYWNPLGRGTALASPLLKLVTGDYDVVHGHTFLPAVPTRLASAFTDAATVFTVHGTAMTTGVGRDESSLAGVKRRLERQFVLGFDYDSVISVNQEHVDLLASHHDNVETIVNGVDLERFAVDVERTDDILFLGRLAPKKRVSDLISAFAQVTDEFPETDLNIVGTGPKRDELEELAASLGSRDRISFLGRVSDEEVVRQYASSRVFVLPSVWEGHPLTLLEAWASGTPVIASSVEGIQEFIDHEENGYLVPPKDPDSLASALRYVLSNPDTAREWGDSARELVRAEYSWEGVASRTHELYRSLR